MDLQLVAWWKSSNCCMVLFFFWMNLESLIVPFLSLVFVMKLLLVPDTFLVAESCLRAIDYVMLCFRCKLWVFITRMSVKLRYYVLLLLKDHARTRTTVSVVLLSLLLCSTYHSQYNNRSYFLFLKISFSKPALFFPGFLSSGSPDFWHRQSITWVSALKPLLLCVMVLQA